MFGSTILTQNLGVCLPCIAFPYKNPGQQCARVGNQSGGRRTQGNPHLLNRRGGGGSDVPFAVLGAAHHKPPRGTYPGSNGRIRCRDWSGRH
jgi:hypothetical protein